MGVDWYNHSYMNPPTTNIVVKTITKDWGTLGSPENRPETIESRRKIP
jgi:hypothetical protein